MPEQTESLDGLYDWYKEQEAAFNKNILDPIVGGSKQTLIDAGVPAEERAKLEASAKKYLKSGADSLTKQILSSQSDGGMTASMLPLPSLTDITAQIDSINKGALKSVPGGVYTVGGLSLAFILYMGLRKRL